MVFPVRQYVLGQLVAAWGTPTGVAIGATGTSVYWGGRSALLYTTVLRPDSPIESIVYDLEPGQASAWRGLTRRQQRDL